MLEKPQYVKEMLEGFQIGNESHIVYRCKQNLTATEIRTLRDLERTGNRIPSIGVKTEE